jgi:hypothetical protein
MPADMTVTVIFFKHECLFFKAVILWSKIYETLLTVVFILFL